MPRQVIPIVLLNCALAFGQKIAVGANVQVSAARPDAWHREVVIATDPKHAERLIACSMFATPETGTNTAGYVSVDGGRTWSAPIVSAEKFSDDPTAAYGPDGTVYFIAKTETIYPRHSSSDSDELYIRRSRDGGKTWDPVIRGTLANDRPFMAIDNTNGTNRGNMYVAFNEHVHGESSAHRPGDTAHTHKPEEFRNTVRLVTFTNHADGIKYVYDRVFMDQENGKIASPNVGATLVLSDGTVAILADHTLHGTGGQATTGKPHEEKAWLELFLSTDGGETMDPALKIADIQSTYNLANSRGVTGNMAADTGGGRFNDRLYVVWADIASGRGRILFTRSDDRGKTWSSPKPIDDDSDRVSGGPDDYMPEIAVNKNGVVGVQWYDRRDNPDNKGYYVRFAASLDGGDTWSPSVRVSEAPNSVPQNMSPGVHFSLTGGDTAGLAPDSNGTFHSLWVDDRTGIQQVWTATVDVGK